MGTITQASRAPELPVVIAVFLVLTLRVLVLPSRLATRIRQPLVQLLLAQLLPPLIPSPTASPLSPFVKLPVLTLWLLSRHVMAMPYGTRAPPLRLFRQIKLRIFRFAMVIDLSLLASPRAADRPAIPPQALVLLTPMFPPVLKSPIMQIFA